ncbi:MAG: response regulator [Verrucomicrobiota bacterium]
MSIDAPILIVEDDDGICHLLATALKKDGIVSECRTSGTSALTWLRQNHTPLILLDLRLPDMRGQDVIATLAEEGRKVPFVVISGVGDVRVAVKLMQEGALDFLPKDMQLLQLVAPVVRRSLEHLEQKRRLADTELERKDVDRRLFAAAELERRRLGQDLHDDLCQRLAAIKLHCSMLQRELVREGSAQADRAARNVDAIGEATTLSRSFARSLAPVTLDSNGLCSALQLLAKSAGTIFGIGIGFECPHLVLVPDPDTAMHLYRIAQELIANAAKHARPTRIEMRLITHPSSLLLEVANDGLPFSNPAELIEGMGLHILRARADAIGASLEFISGSFPDGGTCVRCNLPYNPAHESAP